MRSNLGRQLCRELIFLVGLNLSLFSWGAWAVDVEVLHWWTTGGEARSAIELKKIMAEQGIGWKDFAVAGGGGTNAMTALRARVLAKNAPTAAQIKGPAIQEWASEGMLTDLDTVAHTGKWDAMLPPAIADLMKYQGHYVATPINIHRVNWLWVNAEALKKVGAQTPTTWEAFFDTAEKLKKNGIVALAHGGQPWQDATLFESVLLGVAGADFYRQALVNLDQSALTSSKMRAVFETLARMKSYMDKGAAARDWNLTTAMVINGKAGMQFMGDWAKGEFTLAGKVAGRDYYCVPAPGTEQAFVFNIDSLVMFKQPSKALLAAQSTLAANVMSQKFQEMFSLNKGSIPARQEGVVRAKFDSCAVRSMDDMAAASKNHTLLPSLAHNMAVRPATEGAMVDVITQFMNSNMTAERAVQKLAKAAKVK